MTKYNEFYGGVRCYTFISQRAERSHIQKEAAGGGEPRGAVHGKEATAAGAHLILPWSSTARTMHFLGKTSLGRRTLVAAGVTHFISLM